MQDELVPMEEETGEFDDTYDVGVAPDSLSSVIIILTTVFLFVSILMIAIRLHTVYDFWQKQDAINKKEQSFMVNK